MNRINRKKKGNLLCKYHKVLCRLHLLMLWCQDRKDTDKLAVVVQYKSSGIC